MNAVCGRRAEQAQEEGKQLLHRGILIAYSGVRMTLNNSRLSLALAAALALVPATAEATIAQAMKFDD